MAQELSDYFKFRVPGAHFIPSVKAKYWDGYIRLFQYNTGQIYYGLIPHIEKFAESRGYSVEYDSAVRANVEFSAAEAHEFVQSLNLSIQPRDYQYKAFVDSVRQRRQLLVSPTASGKSLIIYLLLRYYEEKALVIVPTTALVHQMSTDFLEYSGGSYSSHMIMAGRDKESNELTMVTTWQSMQRLKIPYFSQFKVVIGDEAHLFKAKSLTGILEKMTATPIRIGLTGTLDGSQTHKLVLEGLFGRVNSVTSTKKLMDEGHIAKLKIKAIVLQYADAAKKLLHDDIKAAKKNSRGGAAVAWQAEMDFLTSYQPRNIFIRNLAISLEGNTLLLFQFVEKHGKILFDLIEEKAADGRKIFFVYGGTDAETREQVRAITEKETDAIIVASFGSFSTGTNIRNIHNLILASPSKSRIRNLQSLGRSLRKSETKDTATLYDIADDLTLGAKKNTTLGHFLERIKIYTGEKFDYKIYKVELNDNRTTERRGRSLY